MARTYLDTKSPIAALATPPGRGALAIIRTSGENAIELCARCFSKAAALKEAPGYTMVHGFVVDPRNDEKIDEIVASVFRSPHSFTGEDSVELSCHGSSAVTGRVIEVLESVGFSPALPGEFSFRAFINGKTDLVRAEAINELTKAQCETARVDALKRLTGALSSEFAFLRSEMLDLLAEIEARLDYPEDEGPEIEEAWVGRLSTYSGHLEKLSKSYMAGRLRQEGALVVVAGRPNAGKSSLFNLIVREERAIVSPEPGTTRDWLEAWIEVGGYALRLVDTAGLRQVTAGIEAEGVRRSRELMERADIVVFLVDGSVGLTPEDEGFLERRPFALKLWNKIDVPGCQAIPDGWLGVSAKKGEHMDELERAVLARLDEVSDPCAAAGSAAPAEEAVRIATERQKILVDRCRQSVSRATADAKNGVPLDMVALDVREAAGALGEITGEIGGEEVFERIFGSFCLGK